MHDYTAILSESGACYAERLASDFDIMLLPRDREISEAVSSHADMLLFALGGSLVVPNAYCEENAELLETLRDRTGVELLCERSPRGERYPNDIALNVLLCSRFAFSLARGTSREAMQLLERHGITHVNVKQGYAACSSLAFGNALVSADVGILRAARSAGLDVLQISPGAISLPGLSEGFIGGASGVCENKIYFLGNIKAHPDGKRITDFARQRGFECVSLSRDRLCDIGGIKFIRNAR